MDVESRTLYYRVIKVVNYFLAEALHVELKALRDFDPSVAQLAKELRTLSDFLKEIADGDYDNQAIAMNAFQACLVMARIADLVATEDGRQEDLEAMLRELEMFTNVPY